MRKRLIAIIIPLTISLAAVLYLSYLYFASTREKEEFYQYMQGMENYDTLSSSLYLPPQQLEIGNKTEPGYTVHFQDISLTLAGYVDVVVDQDLNSNDITAYHIDNEKYLSFRDMSKLESTWILDDPSVKKQIDKAAGIQINTQYDLIKAFYYCTPNDFTVFDVVKNQGVNYLLQQKLGAAIRYDSYQFDNGTVKGFLCRWRTTDMATAALTNCAIPDTYYEITLRGFSVEQVKEMLGSITFDVR